MAKSTIRLAPTVSRSSGNLFLSRICSRTLMGGGQSNSSLIPRCSSLLLSVSADVRSFDDAIALEGPSMCITTPLFKSVHKQSAVRRIVSCRDSGENARISGACLVGSSSTKVTRKLRGRGERKANLQLKRANMIKPARSRIATRAPSIPLNLCR